MRLFLGTNFGHGASVAALNDDGHFVFAVEEGRLIGLKDCDIFPDLALRILTDSFAADEVVWAEGWHRWRRFFLKGLMPTVRFGVSDRTYFKSRLLKETRRLFDGFRAERRWGSTLKRPMFVGHHLSHALSLLPWGLPSESVVLVSDTTGESAAISAYYWGGETMECLFETPYPHSLGAAFHQMAVHLGFRGRTAPGKLMALAGYGNPIWLDELKGICRLSNQGFRFILNRYPAWHRTSAWQLFAATSASSSLKKAIHGSFRGGEGGRDLARSVQDWFSETSIELIGKAVDIARNLHGEVTHVGLAGGAALNCQTNGRLVRSRSHLGIKSVVISPWSDDCGSAIGAAVWAFKKRTGRLPRILPNSFLGPPACSPGSDLGVSSSDILRAATALQKGKIIALVSGRLEFGPRALGNRCLLGDPRVTEVRDKLNFLKGRPLFMPLAPVVLQRDFESYFVGEGSTNMAWTVLSKPKASREIAGAIHVTGEARVQVLHDDNDSLLRRILEEFRNLTGVGVLLLTSFNGRNEPLVPDIVAAKALVKRLKIDGMISDSGWSS